MSKLRKEKKVKLEKEKVDVDEARVIKNSIHANNSILEMKDISEETKKRVRAQTIELNEKLKDLKNA